MTRTATIDRRTAETAIELTLDLDGRGRFTGQTGVGFLDHMLAHLAKHSLCDVQITATGDLHVDDHHTVEDVAICLAQAFAAALGDKAGIRRYGWARVPMDEALAAAAVDLGGRAGFVFRVTFRSPKIGTFDTQLIQEFWSRFAAVLPANIHLEVPYGNNDHHIAEALFKAAAMALRQAKDPDPARAGEVPSTKGTLSE